MMKRIAIHKLLKLLLPLLLIIGGKQCCANTVSISLHFYHDDHLGSASWITNDNGTPVQHLQYMPYGEPFVNERISSSSYEERYTFTGKTCSPLLCYRFVSTTLAAQIPSGNAIANSQGLLHSRRNRQ